jgi:hypothetical protein
MPRLRVAAPHGLRALRLSGGRSRRLLTHDEGAVQCLLSTSMPVRRVTDAGTHWQTFPLGSLGRSRKVDFSRFRCQAVPLAQAGQGCPPPPPPFSDSRPAPRPLRPGLGRGGRISSAFPPQASCLAATRPRLGPRLALRGREGGFFFPQVRERRKLAPSNRPGLPVLARPMRVRIMLNLNSAAFQGAPSHISLAEGGPLQWAS